MTISTIDWMLFAILLQNNFPHFLCLAGIYHKHALLPCRQDGIVILKDFTNKLVERKERCEGGKGGRGWSQIAKKTQQQQQQQTGLWE